MNFILKMIYYFVFICIYGINLFVDNNLEAFKDISKIEESVNLEGINDNKLKVTNFIDLSISLILNSNNNYKGDDKDDMKSSI